MNWQIIYANTVHKYLFLNYIKKECLCFGQSDKQINNKEKYV